MILVIQDTGSLTSALAELGIFGPEIIYQVKGGEMSGELANVLMDISRTFEEGNNIKRNLAVMLIYPTILVCILLAAIYIISTYVMPQIMQLVEEIKAPLTTLSRVVIAISGFIAIHGGHILFLIALALIGFMISLRFKPVRIAFDAVLLRLPVVRDAVRMMDLIRFSNVFSSLFRSGVELEASLDCSARTVKNYPLKKAMLHAKNAIIKDGADFTEALGETGLFGETELQLIDIGAGVSTTRLCEVFKTMSTRTAQVLETQIKAMLLMIEPAIILILGTVAGLFIIGIYSPIYAIVQNM
jgi:type II secretory pathway component PulF